jgi:flagellar hook-length control protein FliK
MSSPRLSDGELNNTGHPTVSETIHPLQPETGLEKSLTNTENIDRQVDSSATLFPQRTVEPAVKTEFTSAASFKAETSQQLDHRQTSFQREARTVTNDASLQVPPAATQKTPISLQPDASIRVDSGKQDLNADPTSTTDENILSVEKGHEPIEKLEPPSLSTNSIKDSVVFGPVEKGPTIQVDPHAIEVVQQVIRQLNGRLKSGPTSMHLQLNPESLGAIEVEVVRDVQGVSVTFFAEQTSTGKLLETQLGQLRQSLADSGVQLSGLNIGQHSHSGQEGGFGQQNTKFAQHAPREPIHSAVNTSKGPRAEQVTGQTSEINYLI